MCEFISWVEKRGKVYFLDGETVFSDKFQTWAKEKRISTDDYCGHGTIRAWYGIDTGDGVDKEYTNFSTPDKFPKSIVKAIKAGQMKGFTVPKGLLIDTLEKDYLEKMNTLEKDYHEKIVPLKKDYQEKRVPLDKDYWEKRALLYKDYLEKTDKL